LPVLANGHFAISPYPDYPQEGISYEVLDGENGKNIPGIFVAGWSRLASYGLVGISGKDGARGAQALFEYLQADQHKGSDWPTLEAQIHASKKDIVNKTMLGQLYKVEAEIALKKGIVDYKFATNQEMLMAMKGA